MSGLPRRRRRQLRDCTVTHHALDSYLNRVPEARKAGARAREELAEIADGATFLKRRPTGEEIWRVRAHDHHLRLVVYQIARRPPLLLTVIAEEAS